MKLELVQLHVNFIDLHINQMLQRFRPAHKDYIQDRTGAIDLD